jgi:hypothetical protein
MIRKPPTENGLPMKLWFEREILPAFADYIPPEVERLGPASATPDDPLAAVTGANGIIASVFRYDGALLSRTPDLLVISRTGIGYDAVDVHGGDCCRGAGLQHAGRPHHLHRRARHRPDDDRRQAG